jgi:hypothetical protein
LDSYETASEFNSNSSFRRYEIMLCKAEQQTAFPYPAIANTE